MVVGGALFDGREWIADAAVVIEGGVVSKVGEGRHVDRPAGVREVDLTGHWIVPGLVDCRAAVVGAPPDAPTGAGWFKVSGPILALRGAARANAMLSGGITAVAQLEGGDPEHVHGVRDAVRLGLVAGPVIVSAGRISPRRDGHVPAGGGHGLPLPGTGMRRPASATEIASTPDGFRKTIRRGFVEGADMVMLLLTGDEPSEQVAMTDAELGACAHEAQRVGARVACRARGLLPAKAAVRAGIDLLVGGPDEPDDELVDMLARGRTAWAPGLVARGEKRGGRVAAAVREVHSRGGRIVVGTGSRPDAPVPFVAEVAAIQDAGLGADDALVAATVAGATALGLGEDRVSAGARPAFVAFDRDPVADPTVLGRPGAARFIAYAVPGRRLTPLQSILGVQAAS